MSENGKQIASFIALTVAIAAPIAMAQDTYSDELLADASVMIQRPEIVNPTVARYAGPEYFGFGGPVKAIDTLPNPQIPKIQDTAQYMQVQSNVLKDVNTNTQINANSDGNMVNINNVKQDTNFINTEYGSVKVLDPTGHYIFK